ncbi:MAG: peptidase M28, partial [Proteobacteria bacterium]|nr:peptidase M28 [Pseudomonadota bacterium]
MKRLFFTTALVVALTPITLSSKAQEAVHHHLRIVIYPEESRFTAEDRVTVTEALLPESRFVLHKGLDPISTTPGVNIVREIERLGTVPLESFKVKLPHGQNSFVLKYGGKIDHPLEPYGKEYARGFRQTPGLISGEGVYLSGDSFWYPIFDKAFVTFRLEAELPVDWSGVSQGERTRYVREGDTTSVQWDSPELQEEIFVVAGRFVEYTQRVGQIEAMAFLRTPDPELAKRYLDATARYVAMYAKLIGPYPYRKFALVENFWETGFGMPSFTLLGPKVVRFPFILHSSYPHEILHNWWGNGVFPDYSTGNWAEGLTAYLSDHLMKEQRSDAVEYRQATLQKYADYVIEGRDFPLVKFHARHSSSSEAVGYGKSLMFFHMLRLHLGDEVFVQGIQDFYQKNRFRFASFDNLRQSFELVSGTDLTREFNQWVRQPGAPELNVIRTRVAVKGDEYVLTAILEQVQPGQRYLLRIPVAVTLEGREKAFETVVVMEDRRHKLKLHVPSRPLRLDIDPEFDLFRRLDREEIPPALTRSFGAQKMLILLPSSTNDPLFQAYWELSESLSRSGPDEVEIKLDTEVESLPPDRAVTLLGWENRFQSEIVSALSEYHVNIDRKGVSIGGSQIQRNNHSVVLTARLSENRDLSLTWVASDLPEALPGLGRKLPHYHKYSYLVFEGVEPVNVVKGRWPVLNSPMTVFLPFRNGPIPK